MKSLAEIKKGCGKWRIVGRVKCGINSEPIGFAICPICQALLEQAQEFEKMIETKLDSDLLAKFYKEHEEYMETLSSMEICNGNHNCNEFVIKQELLKEVRGDEGNDGNFNI